MENVKEVFEKAYKKFFEDATKDIYSGKTMEYSGLKFRIQKGSKLANETFAWKLVFDKCVDFGYGNWNEFYFKDDRELGKFLFECFANKGLPNGAKNIIER